MENPNHIEIVKEDIHKIEYYFRPFPGAPKPPQRNRGGHGDMLKNQLSVAVSTISNDRQSLGLDANNLIVMRLSSALAAPKIDILSLFNLSIVEEVKELNGTIKFVIQFNSKDDIALFESERELWESDSKQGSAVLTYERRRDLFACIESIGQLTAEDRTGKFLAAAIASDNLPDGLFTVDIDVWFDNNHISKRNIIQAKIIQALGTTGSSLCGDLFVLPNLLLGRARVDRFTLEALRKLDLVAKIELPIGTLSTEQCELYAADFVPTVDNTLDANSPLACVIDSGVFSGNPLLSSLIVGEEDFDLTENTTSDLNGHGTGVAGIVVYGDFHNFDKTNRVFKPLVRICNGKVMHNLATDRGNETSFSDSDDKRPEQIVYDVIHHFCKEYNCRIFNLSCGNPYAVYDGGRQMAWASMLDEISLKLDILIVVSSGNVSDPNIPTFSDRNDLMEQTRNQLLNDEHRLIDPATTALGITVGSISRYGEPEIPHSHITTLLSVGKEGYPSAFTRTGEGVNGAIKPEFVDYGGNLAIHQIGSSQAKWRVNRALNEPTLNNTLGSFFKGWQGTSFAAPHVTHIAARLQQALHLQLSKEPTSNLIRALLASSAKYIEKNWLDSAVPFGFVGDKKQKQGWRLRLSGYGKVDDTTLFTDRNHVTLFAEEALDLRQIHLYKIPVPPEFLELKASKRISIGFAYNPPTRLSRKEYIANSLWFEVIRRLEADTLLGYFDALREYNSQKRKNGANIDATKIDGYIDEFGKKHSADFKPGSTVIRNSTLQQRVWEKSADGGGDLLWEDNDPYIYVLVTGKAKFKHIAEQEAQPYALAITFSYESEIDIQLRQKLSAQVTLKQREQAKTRTQVKI
jgi:hypothetical protein